MVVAAGAIDGLGLALDSSALVEVVEALDSGSAAAIAPPALPTRRPVVSTQTAAAKRNGVEILGPSQPASDLVGRLSKGILAQFSLETHPITW